MGEKKRRAGHCDGQAGIAAQQRIAPAITVQRSMI
jgi:hypothetical protein